MPKIVMPESDLYPPLKQFLERQGYEVKGEVQNCDVVAVRGDESPIVVELKRSLNLDVILQAVDRLSRSPQVYIGVPQGCGALKRRRRQVIKLLQMLGLGLVTIEPKTQGGNVRVILEPVPYRPRQSKRKQGRLLKEFAQRVGDPNMGGTAMRQGIMTAYRQKALNIAQLLQANGPMKAAAVAKALNEPKARDILYRNVYGWFERISLGVYQLSVQGEQAIPDWQNSPEP